jgi:hypothetical protein
MVLFLGGNKTLHLWENAHMGYGISGRLMGQGKQPAHTEGGDPPICSLRYSSTAAATSGGICGAAILSCPFDARDPRCSAQERGWEGRWGVA